MDKSLINTRIVDYNFPSYISMIEGMKNWIDNSKLY